MLIQPRRNLAYKVQEYRSTEPVHHEDGDEGDDIGIRSWGGNQYKDAQRSLGHPILESSLGPAYSVAHRSQCLGIYFLSLECF